MLKYTIIVLVKANHCNIYHPSYVYPISYSCLPEERVRERDRERGMEDKREKV